MKLGVFLAIGESLEDLKSKGQLDRLLDYNIRYYSKSFKSVYIFSYNKETATLPKNCKLITNKTKMHRYLYCFMMPIINKKYIQDCDVIRGLQMTSAVPAIFAKILFAKKFVFNYGYDYRKVAALEGKRIRSLVLWPMTFLTSVLSDAIIITSNRFRSDLFPNLNKNKINLIPNGVDTKLFKPVQKSMTKKTLNVLFVGRLEREKNIENLLFAISHFKKIILTIVGQGSQESEIKSLFNKLKIRGQIIEKVDYKKLALMYRSSDIFILPSFSEGHPKVLLEAQSCGLVCLASDIPGNRDIVTHQSGILFKPTEKGIREAFKKVLNNSKFRAKLSYEARSNAVERFELSTLLYKEVKLIKSIAQR